MALLCPRCRRANPDVAVYCYFDGVVLRQGAVVPTPSGDPSAELVFSSGRRCRSLDDLAQGCQEEWEEACQLLKRGELARFLVRSGRVDLAQSAQEAETQPEPDIALYNFLNQLPASRLQGPRLELRPRRLTVNTLAVGEQQEIRLTVGNQGKGMLQGKLIVSEGHEWIKVPTGDGKHAVIKTSREQQLTLRLDTRVLVGGQVYSGRLTVITNGGIAEVPLRLELKAVPFPLAPYRGATAPRELAQRIKSNPRPAVALLENGEVARWFARNGWNYPVPGEPARGVGAVQQLFEYLGLSKPPPLQLSEYEMRLECVPPQQASGQVTLRTASRKWVYAQVEADVPWLVVTTPTVSGPQQAAISFAVDPSTLDGDGSHQAVLLIRANAGQKLKLRLKVEVRRPRQSQGSRLLRAVLVGTFLALMLRLFLALPADLFAHLLTGRSEAGPRGGLSYWAHWSALPGAEATFLRHFVMATWFVGGLIGLGLVWQHGGRWSDRFFGAVAGCGAGLAVCSLLGCLLLLLDGVPRWLLATMPQTDLSAWVATPCWELLAVAWWAFLGGCVGLLLWCLGRLGLRCLAALAAPLAFLFQVCGLKGLAAFLALR